MVTDASETAERSMFVAAARDGWNATLSPTRSSGVQKTGVHLIPKTDTKK